MRIWCPNEWWLINFIVLCRRVRVSAVPHLPRIKVFLLSPLFLSPPPLPISLSDNPPTTSRILYPRFNFNLQVTTAACHQPAIHPCMPPAHTARLNTSSRAPVFLATPSSRNSKVQPSVSHPFGIISVAYSNQDSSTASSMPRLHQSLFLNDWSAMYVPPKP